MSRNNQQPTCGNAACRNQTNNKTLPTRLLQWRDGRKRDNIQGDIRTLIGKDCEVEMMFFREMEMFGEI